MLTNLDQVPERSQLSYGLSGYGTVGTNDHVTSGVLEYLIDEPPHT